MMVARAVAAGQVVHRDGQRRLKSVVEGKTRNQARDVLETDGRWLFEVVLRPSMPLSPRSCNQCNDRREAQAFNRQRKRGESSEGLSVSDDDDDDG